VPNLIENSNRGVAQAYMCEPKAIGKIGRL
jgi:hypothetical protein